MNRFTEADLRLHCGFLYFNAVELHTNHRVCARACVRAHQWENSYVAICNASEGRPWGLPYPDSETLTLHQWKA